MGAAVSPNDKKPVPIIEDVGLGLCLQCLTEYKVGERAKVNYALTLAPSPVPLSNGMQIIGIAAVAVPACWDHLAVTHAAGEQQSESRLIIPPPGVMQ